MKMEKHCKFICCDGTQSDLTVDEAVSLVAGMAPVSVTQVDDVTVDIGKPIGTHFHVIPIDSLTEIGKLLLGVTEWMQG